MGKNINTRMAPKSWVACTKPEGKGMNSKTSVKADKRDITLLVLLLRHRITPPVPYIIITEIILSMSPDTYQDSCHKNCRLENLTEEQQYHWFAWWCKEMEKKEIMKGGGRWVAAVNWENERIKEICGCLRDQLQGRGPVFELVDQEGVARLKLQVGQKKQLIKQNKILKEKEDFIRAQEDQSTLQADWYLKNDWRYGSVPDLTLLSPKSVIGQGYPLDDFLRPFDDDLRSWNLTFETASTISAPSTHSSSASLTTWSNSSTITASTMPLGYTDEEEKILKTVNKYKATKKFEKVMDFKEAMRNKLDKLDMAEREGRLVNDWMMTESMVRVC
ncbi:uncharacterized protein EAF02_002279 [Botrytis sinoallii]|uniref:uncharacterized protein n=1 Tax=Botrytis sinoallii TaxID=1463999 RepID=UPI0018FF63B1|nr:uncharacterized protein EAF02_002279 [Botrytis sinoallii]KAF7889864.1 hypothetical protein EAF02_002279 [Botrytis sinoallii]